MLYVSSHDIIVVVQYAVFLFGYLKEWRRNPQWSFSCCMALLLPLNDLQGDITGITGTDVLKNQLQTGAVEMPTILGAVKDSGVIDVTLEGDQEDGDHTVKATQDDNCQGAEYNNARHHRGTQTELSTFTSAGPVVYEQVAEINFSYSPP